MSNHKDHEVQHEAVHAARHLNESGQGRDMIKSTAAGLTVVAPVLAPVAPAIAVAAIAGATVYGVYKLAKFFQS